MDLQGEHMYGWIIRKVQGLIGGSSQQYGLGYDKTYSHYQISQQYQS